MLYPFLGICFFMFHALRTGAYQDGNASYDFEGGHFASTGFKVLGNGNGAASYEKGEPVCGLQI
jgi:hypothetical protein